MCEKLIVVTTFCLGITMCGTANSTIISIATGTMIVGDRSSNLVANGSFENRVLGDPLVPNTLFWSGVSGSHTEGPLNASVHTIPGWNQTSGPGAYGAWGDSTLLNGSPCADGLACLYFGNFATTPSSPPIFNNDGTVTFGSTPTFTNLNSNNQTPTSLEQPLSGLTIGATYLLDFWTTGEHLEAAFPDPGVFGLSIGGSSVFLTAPSVNSVFNANSIRYFVTFIADNVMVPITFTNWGHITTTPLTTTHTELVLDDVIVNRISEPGTFTIFSFGVAVWCARRHQRAVAKGQRAQMPILLMH